MSNCKRTNKVDIYRLNLLLVIGLKIVFFLMPLIVWYF